MLEIIAVIFTLLSVWLTRKQSIWCWLTGITGTICYFFIFKKDHSWANMDLQIIFIGQALYGWIKWGKYDDRKIRNSSKNLIILNMIICLLFILFLFLINVSLSTDMTYLDMITTGISLYAMILTAHKKIECWSYWAIADFIYIIFFIHTKLYWSAGLYLVLLINAYFGYKEWEKNLDVSI